MPGVSPVRCFGDGDALYAGYHDHEWGRPVLEEGRMLELLCLEGFQAGLSWLTVLRRRETLRRALCGFAPAALAALGPADLDRLMTDPGVIRHRAKLEAAVANARAALALAAAGEGLVPLVWSFRPPSTPPAADWSGVPAESAESSALARELRRRGFRFVGPTTAQALLQAAGVVNDHLAACPVRAEVEAERRRALARLRLG